MKTNPFARAILKIRVALFCFAFVGLAGGGLALGDSLAVRYGHTNALRGGCPQAPNVHLGQLIDATH